MKLTNNRLHRTMTAFVESVVSAILWALFQLRAQRTRLKVRTLQDPVVWKQRNIEKKYIERGQHLAREAGVARRTLALLDAVGAASAQRVLRSHLQVHLVQSALRPPAFIGSLALANTDIRANRDVNHKKTTAE